MCVGGGDVIPSLGKGWRAFLGARISLYAPLQHSQGEACDSLVDLCCSCVGM